jgi:hypothetical protein
MTDEILAKAKALDEMERSVTSSEADVLERVLEAFKEGKRPKIIDPQKIDVMYSKYLESKDDDAGDAGPGEDSEYPEGEELDL